MAFRRRRRFGRGGRRRSFGRRRGRGRGFGRRALRVGARM